MTARIDIDFPFAIGPRGRTATTDYAGHVRDMIEQLLFTSPGERVNRPDFGAGVLQAVFAAASPEAATALEFATRASLQRHLGDIVEVQGLVVRAEGASLRVSLDYALRSTGERVLGQNFELGNVR